jgi:hypothetical protein
MKIAEKARVGEASREDKRQVGAILVGWMLSFLWLMSLPTMGAQGQWQIEIVDGGVADVGRFSALAIDHDGNLHVSYNQFRNTLRYAYRGTRDKQWYKMTVDTDGGTFISLAVDSKDRPHIAYNSMYLSGLHYAYWNGSRWIKQNIDPARTSHLTSIGLDSSGNPRISYYLEETPDRRYALLLKYAYFDGKTWYVQTLDHHITRGKFNSIAIDDLGNPHIAYSDQGAGDLRYIYSDGSGWQTKIPDARHTHNNYVGIGNSIALDAAGDPAIAYLDTSRHTVKFTRWTENRWATEVVDQLVDVPSIADRVSLKLDSHGLPHIAYYDGGLGELKYAWRDDKNDWHVSVVDSKGGNVGQYPALCLGTHDEPYISYYDANSGQLLLAYLQGPSISN